jgi:hypothetical protein
MRVLRKSEDLVTTHAYRQHPERKKSAGTGWLRSGQLTTCHTEFNKDDLAGAVLDPHRNGEFLAGAPRFSLILSGGGPAEWRGSPLQTDVIM